MKQFIINALKGLFLITLFLGIMEIPIQLNYDKQNSNDSDWHVLESINAEVLFIGNSRCLTTFDTPYLTKSTSLQSFDLGQNSYKAKFIYSKTKHYTLQNTEPRFVFIQCDRTMVGANNEWYRKVEFLKYIFLDREHIKEEVSHLKGYEEIDWWIPAIRYGSFPERYVYDALGKFVGTQDRKLGFSPRKPITNHTLPEIPYDTLHTNIKDLNYIDSIAHLFPNSEIFLVHPPMSQKLCRINNTSEIHKFASSRKWPLIDFSEMQLPDSMFENNTHVNSIGSHFVSDSVSTFIRCRQNALQQP